MFSCSTLLSFLFLTLSTTTANATPIRQRSQNNPVLGLVAKINASGSKHLADIDRARLAGLITRVQGGNARAKRTDGTVVAIDDGIGYSANVSVGSPPTNCKPCRSLSTPLHF